MFELSDISSISQEHVDVNHTKLPDGSFIFRYRNSHGNGIMHCYSITPQFYIASIDFHMDYCPLYSGNSITFPDWTINYCIEGRCEVALPDGRTCIIRPGDCCVSNCDQLPSGYHYPLGHYKGIEIYLDTNLLKEDSFSLLREAGFSSDVWTKRLRSSLVIFRNHPELNQLLDTIPDALNPFDTVSCKLKLIEILRYMDKIGVPSDHNVSYYSKSQIQIARQTHALLTSNLEQPYHLEEIAAQYKISVSTLNNYFQAVYGKNVPSYIREYRMQAAALLLADTTRSIYDIAASVGYSNPSKFGAAFKKFYNVTPSEYRRQEQLF